VPCIRAARRRAGDARAVPSRIAYVTRMQHAIYRDHEKQGHIRRPALARETRHTDHIVIRCAQAKGEWFGRAVDLRRGVHSYWGDLGCSRNLTQSTGSCRRSGRPRCSPTTSTSAAGRAACWCVLRCGLAGSAPGGSSPARNPGRGDSWPPRRGGGRRLLSATRRSRRPWLAHAASARAAVVWFGTVSPAAAAPDPMTWPEHCCCKSSSDCPATPVAAAYPDPPRAATSRDAAPP
jgi:hypothetical protein